MPKAGGGSSTDLITLKGCQEQNDREALPCLAIRIVLSVQLPLHQDPALEQAVARAVAGRDALPLPSPTPVLLTHNVGKKAARR